ncbi:MAG: DUF4091 domain-containing protein [Clostridia bacterium]|nr:DUF4091 domain-containing protein [Clostridia bacterium]
MSFEYRILSSLEKVFCDEEPAAEPFELQGFQNEILSFQIAFCYQTDDPFAPYLQVSAGSDLTVRALQVRQVPVRRPAYQDADEHYLRKEPGLFPDLLREITPVNLRPYPGQWESIWIEIDPGERDPGDYTVDIRITDENGTEYLTYAQPVRILPGRLPAQRLIHTQWLYTDCLARYYHVPVFSEEHWRVIEQFIRSAAGCGVNMILTPIHTPPVDTRENGERLTTQLVDVFVENGEYRFNTDKLRRWIRMCRNCGIRYFEMAHLYTQWGARHAPKIMATADGVPCLLFGWSTDAGSDEYRRFLNCYIPAIRQTLREEEADENTWWHISDEPSFEHLPSYSQAKKQVAEALQGCHIIDALSNFDFYRQGVVTEPVVATNHVRPFLEAAVPDLWLYYCCGQHIDLSNQFIAMPYERTRIIGMQLFACRAKGFPHWGYNYYNAQLSDYPIDPYAITDGDGFTPAGDVFLVYPGNDGVPEASIRYFALREAMQDLRALEWLAGLTGREHALQLLNGITIDQWPEKQLPAIRRAINEEIVRAVQV